jgi:hypothetical protein
VRFGVLTAEVVRVVGGDHGDVELALEAVERFVNLLLVFEALILNFEKEVALAEDVLVLDGRGAGFLVVASKQVFAEFAAEAAGEADEALRMFCEVALADAGLAVER